MYRGKISRARHKHTHIHVYGCMCRNVKCFKSPLFCSPLLLHLYIWRDYGPNHSRKRHSIKEIWQQDKQAIVIVCDRATGRLQILVTTGGNISVACCYHMVCTKGERYLFIAMSVTTGYLFQRHCFLMILHCLLLWTAIPGPNLKWTWLSKGHLVSACVYACVCQCS